jgi:hypothetical protein
MSFKMGFYKFFTTLSNYESASSISKIKSGDKLIENKPNNSDKEYSFLKWFVGFSDASNRKKYSTKTSNNNKLSLVVWGTNLTSQVSSGRFTKQVSNMIQLPPYQKSVIIGLLLSDGWLTIANKTSKNARLGFKQSLSKTNYVCF